MIRTSNPIHSTRVPVSGSESVGRLNRPSTSSAAGPVNPSAASPLRSTQLHIVHDDEAFQMRLQPLVLVGRNIQFQSVVLAPNRQVALHPPLRIQHQVPRSAVRPQLVYRVRYHPAQPAESVLSMHRHALQPAQVMHRRLFGQCLYFPLWRVQLYRAQHATIRPKLMRCCRMWQAMQPSWSAVSLPQDRFQSGQFQSYATLSLVIRTVFPMKTRAKPLHDYSLGIEMRQPPPLSPDL